MSKEIVSQTAQIIASVAHDLRSPLNAIIGFSRVMLKGIDGPLSDMQATDLEAIYANGNAMLGMVDSVIDLAKVEAGRLEPSPTAVYVEFLLDKVLSLTAPSIRAGKVELVRQERDAPPPVWADPAQIQKSLERLVTAAIQLVGSGSVTLTTVVDEESVVVRIAGLASEGLVPDTPHILRAFHSSGTLPDQRVDAIALKMLASEQLIALNGGSFSIEGPSEEQIAFILSLPLAQRQHEAA